MLQESFTSLYMLPKSRVGQLRSDLFSIKLISHCLYISPLVMLQPGNPVNAGAIISAAQLLGETQPLCYKLAPVVMLR